MLGHKMLQKLGERFDGVAGLMHGQADSPRFRHVPFLRSQRLVEGADAADWERLHAILRQMRPACIVNCIGIIKQREEAHAAIPSLLINSLLPHRLAEASMEWGGRLIHFSTDCVFSGKRGGYCEEDPSDALDLYGRTKFLGEVAGGNTLTLRTSIIGRELAGFRSLLEWFLAQRGSTVQGYRAALYSGVTTNYLAGLVARIIQFHPGLTGLYHVAGPAISKYDLLCLIRDTFQLDIGIQPVEGEVCDRTLRADRFLAATGYVCPDWPELIAELHQDPTPYASWRNTKTGEGAGELAR